MASYGVVRNVTGGPLPITRSGRQVEGSGWAAVNLDEPLVARALEAGHLVAVERPKGAKADDLDPAFVAALEAAKAGEAGAPDTPPEEA